MNDFAKFQLKVLLTILGFTYCTGVCADLLGYENYAQKAANVFVDTVFDSVFVLILLLGYNKLKK